MQSVLARTDMGVMLLVVCTCVSDLSAPGGADAEAFAGMA